MDGDRTNLHIAGSLTQKRRDDKTEALDTLDTNRSPLVKRRNSPSIHHNTQVCWRKSSHEQSVSQAKALLLEAHEAAVRAASPDYFGIKQS